jgi:prepilin-type N-terminal cleavage/methylation domain-containing protein
MGSFRIPNSAFRIARGFTLLELMLAMSLLATGTIAIVELIQRAQMASRDGEQVLIATYLAERRLEELRNVAYASLASEARASVSSPSGFTQFDRQVTVTTPFTNLRQIVVTVYWDAPGPAGETNVSLQTYRSNI